MLLDLLLFNLTLVIGIYILCDFFVSKRSPFQNLFVRLVSQRKGLFWLLLHVHTSFFCWRLYHQRVRFVLDHMGRAKRIWYLSPMRAAKVQASLRIRAVSPEPSLLAHTSSESRGTFRQKARSLAPLNGWACAVKICHDGMLEDTNSLDGAHILKQIQWYHWIFKQIYVYQICFSIFQVLYH